MKDTRPKSNSKLFKNTTGTPLRHFKYSKLEEVKTDSSPKKKWLAQHEVPAGDSTNMGGLVVEMTSSPQGTDQL